MPLDPKRYIKVRLTDPSHTLPMPGTTRFFSAEGETVDVFDGFWIALLADGSVTRAPAAPAPAPATRPAISAGSEDKA